MSDEPRKRGLGRGLSALMADLEPVEEQSSTAATDRLPIEKIVPSPDQPRREFDEEKLNDLAASIREKGLLQPLIVRKHPETEGRYQLVAGERRWRAAQLAQLHEVPVIQRELTDEEVIEIAIIENVQRVDLNPLEEAQSFEVLVERFGHTQEQVAKALGKSRSHIANMLRLTKLPHPVQRMVRAGQLSMGHARALLSAEDPLALAHQVVSKDLSVRATEALVKAGKAEPKETKTRAKPQQDADTRALQDDLSAALGLAVAVKHGSDGSGSVTIRYKDLDQLDSLCEALSSAGTARAAR